MKTRVCFFLFTFCISVSFYGQDVRLLEDFDGNGLVGLYGDSNANTRQFFSKLNDRLYTTIGSGNDTKFIHVNPEYDIDFLKADIQGSVSEIISPPDIFEEFQIFSSRTIFKGKTSSLGNKIFKTINEGSKVAREIEFLAVSGNGVSISLDDIKNIKEVNTFLFFSAIH